MNKHMKNYIILSLTIWIVIWAIQRFSATEKSSKVAPHSIENIQTDNPKINSLLETVKEVQSLN